MDEEKVRKAFEAEGIKNEIKCPQAFAMSDKYKIPKKDISQYCNSHGVKIRACQLGCFK